MNEKIKELAEKCGFYFYDLHDVDGQDLGETIESDRWSSIEEFAEMLVQECISVMVENDYHGEWLEEKIKEHFGVE